MLCTIIEILFINAITLELPRSATVFNLDAKLHHLNGRKKILKKENTLPALDLTEL